jgi:LysR family transcriptional regulator, low CO2-responsive transcriptional regulator
MQDALDVRDLEAFVAVADTGSFTAAAQALFIRQPSVSARIASLEGLLDTKLLDRLPGGVRPTPAGEVLLAHARALLRDREEAIQAVRNFLGRPAGLLEIGASSIPGAYLLPQALAQLREAYPDVRIRLAITDTKKTVDGLRGGEFEVAVVGSDVDEEGLVARRIGEDEVVLIAAPELAGRFPAGAKLTAPEMEQLPLILREPGSGTRAAALSALEKSGAAVDRLNIILEVGGNAAVREAALRGIGAAFLSRLAVEEPLRSGRVVELAFEGGPLIRPFVLLTRRGKTLSPGALEIARILGGRGKV